MVEKRRVLRGRGRLLSLSGGGRKISTSEAAASWDDLNLRRRASSGETATSSAAASKGSNRLIDCAFVAGLCVDRFTARNVIFSREVFPQDVCQFNLSYIGGSLFLSRGVCYRTHIKWERRYEIDGFNYIFILIQALSRFKKPFAISEKGK